MANKYPANIGDVFKHLVLCRALEDQPSRYLESHGGAFTYDLTGVETGAGGISDFLQAAGPDSTLGATRYAEVERAALAREGETGTYLGSVALANEILPAGTEVIVAETVPASSEALERSLRDAGRPCVIHPGDGNRLVMDEARPGDLVLLDPYDVEAVTARDPEAQSSLTAFTHLSERGVACLLWYALTTEKIFPRWTLRIRLDGKTERLWQMEIQVMEGASGLVGCGFLGANLTPRLEADGARLALTLANELRSLGINARISVDSAEERRVVPSVDGHEEPELLVQHALGVIKGPLAQFVRGVIQANPDVATRQWEARVRRKRGNERKASDVAAEDARELLEDLRDCRADFEQRLDLSCIRTDEDSATIRRCLDSVKHGQTLFIKRCNAAMHGERMQIDDALWTLESLALLARAIQSDTEALQMEMVIDTLRVRQERMSRPAAPPINHPAPGTTTLGIHWVQPRRLVPGAWWMVTLHSGTRIDLEADLTTADVIKRLRPYMDQPALAGLAYCFSIPRRYLERDYDADVVTLWRTASEAAGATDQAEIKAEELGSPFRILNTGDELRDVETQPEFFRATELDVHSRLDVKPASVFDVGGEGSVGALAVKGMRALAELDSEGAAIWPLTPLYPSGLTCVEIFPRAVWATLFPQESPSSKKNPMRRWNFIAGLRDYGVKMSDREARVLGEDERAFDALVTAWSLHQHGGNISTLPLQEDSQAEGQIWVPG